MADAAFEQFVGTSLPALMRHAYALTGNVHAGEDLVQDTLVRMACAWRRIDKDGNPLAYARTVMLRTYLSRWRTLRRRPILQPLVETAAQGDAYGDVDVRDSLRRGLAGLPRMQRAVLVLTYLDDLADEDMPGTASTQFGGGFQPRLHQAELINAVFTDRRHGYVVQQRCSMDVPGDVPAGAPTPDVHQECGSQLLVTADAGHTWRARTLPGDPATKDAGVDLFLGHSLMLWVDGTGELAFGGWHRQYWTTADGGASWHESASPRDTGPAGSFGTFGADDRLTFLATPPPDPMVGKNPSAKNPIVPATDGSFWLACSAGPCVHVTRDHGVTWQTLPTVDSAADVEWVATSDGRTVTASVRTAAGSRLLVRSTDGGSTWTTVLDLAQAGAAGLALANGDVILAEASEEGGVYRLKAGGSTLERLTDAPSHVNALYATGGVVVAAPTWDQREDTNLESVVSVSADGGTTWTAVPAPAA